MYRGGGSRKDKKKKRVSWGLLRKRKKWYGVAVGEEEPRRREIEREALLKTRDGWLLKTPPKIWHKSKCTEIWIPFTIMADNPKHFVITRKWNECSWKSEMRAKKHHGLHGRTWRRLHKTFVFQSTVQMLLCSFHWTCVNVNTRKPWDL